MVSGGRAAAARATLAEAVHAEQSVPAPRRRQAFEVVTEWYAATLPLPYADSMLARIREQASAAPALSDESRSPFENELGLGTPQTRASTRHIRRRRGHSALATILALVILFG